MKAFRSSLCIFYLDIDSEYKCHNFSWHKITAVYVQLQAVLDDLEMSKLELPISSSLAIK